jgi:hypothetical protein
MEEERIEGRDREGRDSQQMQAGLLVSQSQEEPSNFGIFLI